MPNGSLDAAVLCGGLGTRLRDALPGVPKGLAPVGGRPFLELLVEELAGAGVGRIVLCTGVGADAIREHFASRRWPAEVVFSEEPQPLGTGGALALARTQLGSDLVLVCNGDSTVPGLDWAAFFAAVRASGLAGGLVVTPADARTDAGVITLAADGRLLSFAEKPEGAAAGYHSAGIYLFSQALVNEMPAGSASSLERDWLPRWCSRGLFGYVHQGALVDIGTPERWARAQAELS
ncbi:MAG: sugar phosphate nucleotidyltransferase [Terriglobales bacterium]|jgi:NDP-sugar pyrophosphorylase family protein